MYFEFLHLIKLWNQTVDDWKMILNLYILYVWGLHIKYAFSTLLCLCPCLIALFLWTVCPCFYKITLGVSMEINVSLLLTTLWRHRYGDKKYMLAYNILQLYDVYGRIPDSLARTCHISWSKVLETVMNGTLIWRYKIFVSI